jgi:diguanylate cyclase (GGDEF)-like protein
VSDTAGVVAAPDRRAACEAVCVAVRALGDDLLPSVYLVRDGLLRCEAQRGYWQIMDGFPLQVGILGRAVRSGARVVVGDVTGDGDFVAAAPGLVAEVTEPLRVGGAVVGAINVESGSTLSEDVLRAVDRLARTLEARLEGLSRPPETALARLARSTKQLSGLDDEEEIRTVVVAAACEVAQASSGLLVERLGEDLVRTRVAGPLSPALASLTVGELQLLAGHVDRVTSCYTARHADGRTPVGTERLRAAGARCIVLLPLISRGKRTGILLVADEREQELATEEVEALELLGAEAAQSLELAARVAELRARATTDPLTRLGNHSAFYEDLRTELSVGGRLAVLLADVDGFKPINDGHGHLVGDAVLRDLARQLRGALRPTDRVYRVGGDEFAAILLGACEQAAGAVGERLVVAARTVLGRYGAALSVGAAVRTGAETAQELVDRADQALYATKRSRR